jgi:hypothetical protein
MPASPHTDVETAVQNWRDQIEENGRLQQSIADQRAQIEELGRLNAQVLFEAGRFQQDAVFAKSEADFQRRRATMLESSLRALAVVAQQAATSLMETASVGTAACEAEVPPPPLPPITENKASATEAAKVPVADSPLADGSDVPLFLRKDAAEAAPAPQPAPVKTPLPEVVMS